MRCVALDPELGKDRERILGHVVPIAIVDVDAVFRDLDAEVRVF